MPNRFAARAATVAMISALAAAASAPAAGADSNGTDHFVVTQTDYFPKPGDDPGTFYGIFSLDGACGFPSASFTQSDTETFFVAQHQNGQTGYKYNSVGKINDEDWTLTPKSADGTVLPRFSGTADEVATAVGTDNGATASSVNYSFDGTAANAAGHRLHLIIKGVLRTGADGSVTRFDWGVQACQVH
jgi:hypothetical protein